jgi:DeoR/GlpR family transcriptional regulator of sugar metabolism
MKEFEKELLGLLEEKQTLTVEEIAAALYVSPSTVRRRLSVLARDGLVRRTHGGAEYDAGGHSLPSFSSRFRVNTIGTRRIALSALRLIRDGDVIFLDGSTSAFFIAESLSRFRDIKVVTNGIDTLHLLSRYGVDVYSTGGIISKENRSVLVGRHAEEFICGMRADVTFFSAQSILPNGEIYDCFDEENVLRNLMIRHSRRSVFLCDSTKLREISPFRLCAAGDLDYIVCEKDTRAYFDADVKLPELIY